MLICVPGTAFEIHAKCFVSLNWFDWHSWRNEVLPVFLRFVAFGLWLWSIYQKTKQKTTVHGDTRSGEWFCSTVYICICVSISVTHYTDLVNENDEWIQSCFFLSKLDWIKFKRIAAVVNAKNINHLQSMSKMKGKSHNFFSRTIMRLLRSARKSKWTMRQNEK